MVNLLIFSVLYLFVVVLFFVICLNNFSFFGYSLSHSAHVMQAGVISLTAAVT